MSTVNRVFFSVKVKFASSFYLSSMQSKATTPDEYISQLPAGHKEAIAAIRKVILKNLPAGYQEVMAYGMLGYAVPHSIYPPGYHANPKLPLVLINVGSKKNYISLHHLGLYSGELVTWLKKRWVELSDKKLDIGKCCIRFKKPEDVPLQLIGELCTKLTPQQWIAFYEKAVKR